MPSSEVFFPPIELNPHNGEENKVINLPPSLSQIDLELFWMERDNSDVQGEFIRSYCWVTYLTNEILLIPRSLDERPARGFRSQSSESVIGLSDLAHEW